MNVKQTINKVKETGLKNIVTIQSRLCQVSIATFTCSATLYEGSISVLYSTYRYIYYCDVKCTGMYSNMPFSF